MNYRRRFEDYTPSPRTPVEGPWTRVLISEGSSADAVEQIDDQALTPVDPDPAAPATRTITTKLATLPAGWYQLTFTAPDSTQEPTPPVFFGGALAPNVQQVAQFIRARTGSRYGAQAGLFTATSNPTVDQVEEYIATATMDVIAEAGRQLPAGTLDLARRVITIGAAVLIEGNSEQINAERLRWLTSLYDSRLARLTDAAQDVQEGGDPGKVDDRPSPLGTFPCPTPLEW